MNLDARSGPTMSSVSPSQPSQPLRPLRWYGYKSVIRNFLSETDLAQVIEFLKPNGSNEYHLLNSNLLTKLPESHVEVKIKIPQGDNPHERSEELKTRLNTLLTAPGSQEKIVADIVTNQGFYLAIYDDSSPITIEERSLLRILNKLKDPEPELIKEDEYDPQLVFDEAPYIILSIGEIQDSVFLEYLSKACFVYGAARNMWLRPYANKISWRFTPIASSIILPHWSEQDLKNYHHVLESSIDSELPLGNSTYSPGSIVLKNGLWYQLPDFVQEICDLDVKPSTNSRYVSFKGEVYEVSQVQRSIIPDVDWRLVNLARVSEQLTQGLLPFRNQYPEVTLSDVLKRLAFVQDSAGLSVVLKPNDLILGIFSPSANRAKIEAYFKRLWEEGFFLTNYGHYTYGDSESPIPEIGVRKLLISEEMIF